MKNIDVLKENLGEAVLLHLGFRRGILFGTLTYIRSKTKEAILLELPSSKRPLSPIIDYLEEKGYTITMFWLYSNIED